MRRVRLTLVGRSDVLDAAALNLVRLVVMAHVDRDLAGEQIWREALSGLECLIHKGAKLRSQATISCQQMPRQLMADLSRPL